MAMFDKLLANLKADRKTIVFTEGTDERILSATAKLLSEDIMDVILCGNPDEVKAAADKSGFDVSKATVIDPASYGEMGKADALLGGATYSTADTVRPALQIIKTKKGSNLVSSSFILFREKDGVEEKISMGDCAINIGYNDRLDKEGNVVLTAAQQLAEVAGETARTAAFFGIDPKVAGLIFSTYGSGKGATVQLSHDAVIEARKIDPELVIDGEFQFDAAVSPEVAKTKCPDSKVAGQANTFIFPLIEAGNIGYKIAQRLGGYEAYGPILQGLNAPINDLSRGCNADEVYKMAIITAGMA